MTSKSKKAISVSVYKATHYKPKPSKEKHVRAIILRSFQKDGSVEEIIRCLAKRLEKQNWAVVLKSLMIFHRCFRDGDALFIEAMKTRSNQIFALRHFSATAPANHLYTVFVKKYAKYLEEKVSVLRLLGYQFEKNKDAVKGLKPPKCFKIVPKLQSQLNALLNCKMRAQHVGNNQLIHRTYILLMKDSLSLYSMLNDAILQLLDMFWKMDKKNASRVLAIYKLFIKETDALISLYEIGKAFVRQLPDISKAETGIVESMEKYIGSLAGGDDDDDEDGDSRKKTKSRSGKKGKSEKKGDSDEDSDDEQQLAEGNQDEYEYSDGGDKSYEDSDKGSEKSGDSSSGEENEPEDNDWVKQYIAPVAMTSPPASAFAGPSFGPGAAPVNAIMSSGPGQPNFNTKSAILSVFDTAPSPFQAQPSLGTGGSNPFAGSGGPNPFATPPLSGSLIPANTGPSNLFGGSPASSPFGGSPFGSGSGTVSAGASTNIFGPSPAPTGASIFGSTNTSATSLFGPTPTPATGGSLFGTPGTGGSIFGSQPGATPPFGASASANIFGPSTTTPSSSIFGTPNVGVSVGVNVNPTPNAFGQPGGGNPFL